MLWFEKQVMAIRLLLTTNLLMEGHWHETDLGLVAKIVLGI